MTQKLRFLCAKKLQRPQSGQNTAPSDLKVQVRSRPEVHSGRAGIFHLGCVAFIFLFVKLIELFDHTLYYLTWKDRLPHGRGIQYSLWQLLLTQPSIFFRFLVIVSSEIMP